MRTFSYLSIVLSIPGYTCNEEELKLASKFCYGVPFSILKVQLLEGLQVPDGTFTPGLCFFFSVV